MAPRGPGARMGYPPVMLRSTFIHSPGVGDRTERWLWEQGITDWSQFQARREIHGIGPTARSRIDKALDRGMTALEEGDAGHFQRVLPCREAWRMFGDFQGSTRYLDFETEGLDWRQDRITVIGISDGLTSRAFVAGVDIEQFEQALRGAALLVTFNGKSFDVPFLRRQFPYVKLPPVHIDLRHVLRAVGLKGGLKKIEKEIGMDRGDLAGVDGAFAVALWRRHERGDRRALPALMRYNLEDVVNLPCLMVWAYNSSLLQRRAPAEPLSIMPPARPSIDYSRDILREVEAELAARGPWG